ncbi:MAG: DUF2314 domain-containing protein [Planctomycetia bacterium]|nr:DUF2314 domain-containing protein [Planctomycetia bacterium]
MRWASSIILSSGICIGCGGGTAPATLPPNPALSPNAPPDRPVNAEGGAEVERVRAAIAPYVEQARKSYPAARDRYLAGLPAGQHFFVVTELHDASGTVERVFVAVAAISDHRITGRIANEIIGVKGFKDGDPYSFPESELVDWLISKSDGTEEGNVVGKFLDEFQKVHR